MLCPKFNPKMAKQLDISIFFTILIIATSLSYSVNKNSYRHKEILGKDGNYQLEWLVDWDTSKVLFSVTVKTKGYIGLGLSRKGKMSGADIVIGGVLPNGKPYFSDRHAIGNQLPVEDFSQDWKLHEAWESESHTFLSFSRPFETCDENHDLPIHDDVISVIWAYGERDNEIEYHHENRGSFLVYLLSPDLTPQELQKIDDDEITPSGILRNWNIWRIDQQQVIPVQDTAYICSIYKSPVNRKNHVVGFKSVLPTEVEHRHIHHYVLYRCNPPEGMQQDAHRIFDHLVGRREECYVFDQPTGQIPTSYCTEFVHVWAVGQKPVFFPDHVGIPMNSNEYYMLQVHYDNTQLNSGILVNHALEIFYTDSLREHDAGVFSVEHMVPGSTSLIIPPNSLNHRIYGHCASECTKAVFPPSGIRAFGGYLHNHLAGRGVRLLHLRNGKELPWVIYDDNFNFNHQQIRIFREEVNILPGDTLISRCTYENTDRGGNATIGGYPTSKEMCAGIVWYYNKIPLRGGCGSELRSYLYSDFIQICNTTWSNDRREHVVTSPKSNAGLLVSQVANDRIDWTLDNRKRIQEYHRYLPQITLCPSLISQSKERSSQPFRGRWLVEHLQRNTLPEIQEPVEFKSAYPKDIVPYARPSICPNLERK